MARTIFVFILAALALAACGGSGATGAAPTLPTVFPTEATYPQASIDSGRQLFAATCAACHGPEAKGLPGLGKDFTTSQFVKSQTDAQLLDFIKRGRTVEDPANTTGVAMPPKGGNEALTDDDLTAIIAFVRAVNN